jgi:hypothetical protein
MIAIVAVIVLVAIALGIVGFALHLLFSPWLILAAIAILALIKFRPRRSSN